MNQIPPLPVPSPKRGPAEHERRQQIIQAAEELFVQYGYAKTSVADLAKATGVSTAYIYKFFESKQAIGEAVCAGVLNSITQAVRAVAESDESATARLRKAFKTLKDKSLERFFKERKLHDLAATAATQQWCSTLHYKRVLESLVRHIVVAGRQSGEFERKTPLDEVCQAILDCMVPFSHPLLLELKTPEQLEDSAVAMSNLVLRSLAV